MKSNRAPSQVTASLLSLSCFFALVCPLEAQETATEPKQSAEPSETPAITIPRQPGDDVVAPLKDPVESPDAEETEAQAAFMEGIAAREKGEFAKALDAFKRASEADPKAAEPVRERALLLMRLGRISQAAAMAQKAIELDPDDYETRLQLAVIVSTQQSRDIPRALRLIEEALESERLEEKSLDTIRIHRLRGQLYLAASDAAHAGESYDVLLNALERPEDYSLDFREHQRLMRDRETGYETIGAVMLKIGRYDRAITAFEALARINENIPGDYHYLLALAQYRRDDLQEAEKNLNRYFESRQRDREALQLLSDLYTATSRSAEIPEKLEELAKDNSESDNVRMFLGDMLIDKGKADEAAKVFQDVLASTGNADAHLGLIRVDILKRDAESFLQSVNKALRARIQPEELTPMAALIGNDPDFGETLVETAVETFADDSVNANPAAVYFFSQIAQSLKKIEPEGILLESTLKRNPPARLGIEVLSRLGANQYLQEQFEEASSSCRKLLSFPGLPEPTRLMTLYRLSLAEVAMENYDGGIAAIKLAIDLRPQNALLQYQLGAIEYEAERYEDAEQTLKQAVAYAGANVEQEVDIRNLLAATYNRLARWDDAVEQYQKILEAPEVSAEVIRRVRMAMSNAYVQKGDLTNGEKILELVYEDTPDDPGVNNDLGYLYADQNKNLEKAESMIRIAVEAEPENPAYLDSLGWVLYRLKKYDEAVEVLRKATADPEYQDSTILDHLGDVYQALKQAGNAKDAWSKALKVEGEAPSPNEELMSKVKAKLESVKDAATPKADAEPAEEVAPAKTAAADESDE